MQTEVVTTPDALYETFSGDLLTAQLRRGTENPTLGLELVRRGDVVLDVGAHIGTSAIPFARKGARVIAFEPVADSFELLKRNVELNQADVECVRALVSDIPVTMRPTTTPGNTQRTYFEPGESDAETVLLDRFHDGPVSVLKIDVEGMELQVLRGARRILAGHRPAICSRSTASTSTGSAPGGRRSTASSAARATASSSTSAADSGGCRDSGHWRSAETRYGMWTC